MVPEDIISLRRSKKLEQEQRSAGHEADFLKQRAEKIVTTFQDELDLFYSYVYSNGFPLATEVEHGGEKYLQYRLHTTSYGQDPESSDYSISYSNLAAVLMIDGRGAIHFMRLNEDGGVFSNWRPHVTPDIPFIPLFVPATPAEYECQAPQRAQQHEAIMKSGFGRPSPPLRQYPSDEDMVEFIAILHRTTRYIEMVLDGSCTEQNATYGIHGTDSIYGFVSGVKNKLFPDGFTYQERQRALVGRAAARSIDG